MNPEEALKNVFEEIKNGNDLGEPITLVGATKTVDLLTIQRAIDCGLKAVGENRVQEFREKAPFLHGAEIHFIGHLQTNKVKYLIGNVSLIHSVDSLPLAEEISEQSEKKGLVTDVLAEINIGKEPTKSGFSAEQAEDAMDKISSLPVIRAVCRNLKIQDI